MNENIACTVCGTPVATYINSHRPAVVFTPEELRQEIKKGMALYCASCGRTFCMNCLPSTMKLNDIEDEMLRKVIADHIEKFNKGSQARIFFLACPSCATEFGNLPGRDQEVLSKVLNDKEVSLDELSGAMMSASIFVNRLKARNLLPDRIASIWDALQQLIGKVLVPKLALKIHECAEAGRIEEARMLNNRQILWVALLVDDGEKLEVVRTLYKALRDMESKGRGKTIAEARGVLMESSSQNASPEEMEPRKSLNRTEQVPQISQPKEDDMNPSVIQPENQSLQSLKNLFERAFLETSLSNDYLVIQDRGRRINKYVAQFTSEKRLENRRKGAEHVESWG